MTDSPTPEIKLSVLIVTYNSAADIEPCLAAINFSGSYEIIIIDNASQDRTRPLLTTSPALTRHPNHQLIFNPKNFGYARANNQGLALARGEYILLLNPDTVPEPDALNLLVRFLDTNPEVAAVAPQLINPDRTVQPSIRSFPTFSSVLLELTGLPRLIPHSRRLNAWRRRDLNYQQFQFVDQPMASCLLCRRQVLTDLGGFDQQFPIYYNDVDLCYRLRQQGGKIAYLPEAKVVHKLGASTSKVKPKMIYENHRSLFRFLKKHNPGPIFLPKAVILLPLLELSALARALLHRLKNWVYTRKE
ncbi:MAG: glycosyltransferase family 2 protein [candidate division WOR-3 bacterium]|jgi:GT2 family glycosyltransferase